MFHREHLPGDSATWKIMIEASVGGFGFGPESEGARISEVTDWEVLVVSDLR